MSERSRIMELERDLLLRNREVTGLKLRLEMQQNSEDPSGTLSPILEENNSLRDQLSAEEAKHQEEVETYREKLEAQEKIHSEAVAQLQATSVMLSSDKEQLQMRLSQAEKDNVDTVELWRSKMESAMEELKASLSNGADAQIEEFAETKSDLERLKVEHEIALEEAAAKHEAKASALTQEMQAQLSSLSEEKERLEESLRSSVEKAEEQHLVEMEDVLGKLHAAETRIKELEEKETRLVQQFQDKDTETKEQQGDMATLRRQLAQSNQECVALKSQLEELQNQGDGNSAKVG